MSEEKRAEEESTIAVAPPEVEEEEETERGGTRPRREPNYHVIIWDHPDFTGEYVIELLMKLFSHPYETAYEIMKNVDEKGKGIAFTTHKELAELKRDQILTYGPDPRVLECVGSIRASIEAAPG